MFHGRCGNVLQQNTEGGLSAATKGSPLLSHPPPPYHPLSSTQFSHPSAAPLSCSPAAAPAFSTNMVAWMFDFYPPGRSFSTKFSLFNFYRTHVSLGSDIWVWVSQTNWATFCRLNWCDSGWWRYQLNTNWWCQYSIQGNVTMHVTSPGGQLWNQCKWCHLVAKIGINADCITCWPNF